MRKRWNKVCQPKLRGMLIAEVNSTAKMNKGSKMQKAYQALLGRNGAPPSISLTIVKNIVVTIDS